MAFAPLLSNATWRHDDPRSGLEQTTFRPRPDGWEIEGSSIGHHDGQRWEVHYVVRVDDKWTTRQARVTAGGPAGERSVVVDTVAPGRWLVDGRRSPYLDGCFDVDLESSAVTNTLPVHRLGLEFGARAEAPAAYVRSADLAVERLEQTYVRIADDGSRPRYRYMAPALDFTCELAFDESGLIVDYPGIAVRSG